ncbi:MAG: C39 family peptidase [Candidatus Woesearchaeota archaeon]
MFMRDRPLEVRLDVTFEKQIPEKPYCGPTCLAMIFKYYGIESKGQTDLAALFNSDVKKGTPVDDLVDKLKSECIIDIKDNANINDLKDYLLYGIPPMVVLSWQNDETKSWCYHYVLVIGYDDVKECVITHNPMVNQTTRANFPLKYVYFDRLWKQKPKSDPFYDRKMVAVFPKYVVSRIANNLSAEALSSRSKNEVLRNVAVPYLTS